MGILSVLEPVDAFTTLIISEDPPGTDTASNQREVTAVERVERVEEVTMRLMKQELQSVSDEMRSYQSRFKQYQVIYYYSYTGHEINNIQITKLI